MILALATATGCAKQSTQSPQTLATDTECNATGVQSYVGQKWTDTLDAELRRAASSQTLRRLKPGQVMTLELNPFRLSVVTDAQDVITSLYCA